MSVFRTARLYHCNVQNYALAMRRPAQVPLELCLTS